MAVYIVTGKLGNGKSLVSVGRIKEKLLEGCMIATNLDLNLVPMLGANSKRCRVIRVPDKPTAADLYSLGNANQTYDENKNGLLVLDECGTWFNSRNWQDKTRQAVNDWFLHARKLGWDVILIVQNVNLIDSQAREAIAEHTVFCKRLDRMHIPFFGTIWKIISLGEPLRMPRVHIGKVVYGITEDGLLSDRWVYRGNHLFACYDTKQAFLSDYPHGVYSMLPPWYTTGRFQVPRDGEFYMRMTKIYWKRFRSPIAAAAGLLAGVALTASMAFASLYRDAAAAIPAPTMQPQPQQAEHVEEKKESVAEPVKPVSILDQFADLRIVGSLKGKNDDGQEKFYYQFTRAKRGEPPTALITSEEIKIAGIGVEYFSECKAVLRYAAEEKIIYCF